MVPFRFHKATSEADALAAAASANARVIAGGTTLVDLMRETIERPDSVIDINGLPWRDVETMANGALRIGALARMSDVAAMPALQASHRVMVEALNESASPQLRNMASMGGNIMQRTRCPYFRDASLTSCNKKLPGSGCAAIQGLNREHAIFGTSDHCVATHPSDLAVALIALDAWLILRTAKGNRRTTLEEFLLLPGSTPIREHDMVPGELIAAIEIPAASAAFAKHSRYIKIRDRGSYEFALVSVAVALDMDGDTVRGARIAAGGVGTKPWRLRQVEVGVAGAPITEDRLANALARIGNGARPLAENGFKVELLKRTVKRAIREAGLAA